MDGDLDLGTRKLVIVSDPANLVALRLTNMFRLWQGEWFLDTSTGFPWFSILGQKFSKLEAVRQLIARRVLAVPGVKAIEKMTLEPTANRSLRVILRVKTATELVVGSSDTGFVIQSVVGNNPVPVFSSTIPEFAYVGAGDTALAVIGAKIVATTRFLFDGSEIPFLVLSSTGGTVVISASNLLTAGEHTMQLFTPPLGGGSSSTRTFYVRHPVPVVAAVSPTSGAVGVLVNAYVTGSGLSSASIVFVNGVSVATTYNPGPGAGYPRLEFSFTPVTAGDQDIWVENPTTAGGGGTSNTVTYDSIGPTTTSVVPTSATQFDDGPVGALLNGTNFSGSTVVNADGNDYTPTSTTTSQMVFTGDNAFYRTSGSLAVAAKDSSSGYVSNAQIISVAPWGILDLAGLTAWWKVDAGVTNDGSGRCSLWADQSGNGRDLDQVTSGKRPLINQNPLNGIGGLYFDAARVDRLFSALPWSNFVTTSTANIWIVARLAAGTGVVLGDTNGYRSICSGAVSPLRIRSVYDSSGAKTVDTVTFDWQSGPDAFFYRNRHTGGNIYSRVNRTSEQSTLCGNTISTETLAMGGRNGSITSLTGTVYEVIICNQNQTTTNFKRVDNYLANKYGLPLV